MVDSPLYDCQLVLVVKLAAVSKASVCSTPGKCWGLAGSNPWSRRMA